MGIGLGAGELIFVFMVVLLLFGAKRLPEIGSSLGKGIREFKGSVREIEHELKVPDAPKVGSAQEQAAEAPEESSTAGDEPKSLSDDAVLAGQQQ